MILAMGAENAVFEKGGEVSVGLTYMTGTLLKMGQRMARALAGGPRIEWMPYFSLWAGLVAGAVLGHSSGYGDSGSPRYRLHSFALVSIRIAPQ